MFRNIPAIVTLDIVKQILKYQNKYWSFEKRLVFVFFPLIFTMKLSSAALNYLNAH